MTQKRKSKRTESAYQKCGEYIKFERRRRSMTLQQVGDYVGVSANYVSEIERGLKPPSDQFITKFCEYTAVDSREIYSRLKRAPEYAIEELNKNIVAQELIIEIGKNKKLKQKDKERIYNQLLQWYKEVLDSPKKWR